MNALPTSVRIGTRGSALALAQTDVVVQALARRRPELAVEKVLITTTGDSDKMSPLRVIGGRGVFTSALEDALRTRAIDAAVHSAKDLPSETPAGLAIAAFLARADPRDILVSRHGCRLTELPPRPTIATSSRRRAVQVLSARPDSRIVDLRGNIDTRLRKAAETELDGIVLAAAGVIRMGWQDRVTDYLPLDLFVPAPGQGALAIELRAGETGPARVLASLDEPDVSAAVRVERAFLRAIGAGCSLPVGAHATVADGRIVLRAMVASEDEQRVEFAVETVDRHDAEETAAGIARRMLRCVATHVLGANWTASDAGKPLAGMRVLITRAADDAEGLVRALRGAGAEPIPLPTIRIEPVTDTAALDEAIDRLTAGSYDWVVFTSRNAVDRLLARLTELGVSLDVLTAPSVAAVGKATAARLTAAGVGLDLIPSRATADDVVCAMIDAGVAETRVFFPHGDLARETIQRGLTAGGAIVDAVEVYRNVAETKIPAKPLRLLRSGRIDAATFMSPSSVRGFVELLKKHDVEFSAVTVACIGQVTAAAAREAGLRVDAIAEEATTEGLVAALAARWREEQSTR